MDLDKNKKYPIQGFGATIYFVITHKKITRDIDTNHRSIINALKECIKSGHQ